MEISKKIIEHILIKGFECLGENSPMLDTKDIIYSKIGEVWRIYKLSENKDYITKNKKGVFDIHYKAKSFAQLAYHDNSFIQITTGIKKFNHLAAFKAYFNMKYRILTNQDKSKLI